jgi:hypothetical protein
MGIFSHKYTEEGYYQEDELGNIIKVYDNNELIDAMESNKLFYYDGYSMTIVNSVENPKKNRFDSYI